MMEITEFQKISLTRLFQTTVKHTRDDFAAMFRFSGTAGTVHTSFTIYDAQESKSYYFDPINVGQLDFHQRVNEAIRTIERASLYSAEMRARGASFAQEGRA